MSRFRQSHERMTHVYGFLADFAAAYPQLCEGEQAMYRDLCRAAMQSLDDEQKAESMLLKHSVDDFLFRACREDVGTWLLGRLRELGVNVRLVTEGGLRLQIDGKATPAIRARIQRWKTALRDALLQEGLDAIEILSPKPKTA